MLWNVLDGTVYYYDYKSSMPIYVFDSIEEFFDTLNIAAENPNQVYDFNKKVFKSSRRTYSFDKKTKCLKCNANITVELSRCPNCNAKIKKKQIKKIKLSKFLVVIIITGFILACINLTSNNMEAQISNFESELATMKVDTITLKGISDEEKMELDSVEPTFYNVRETSNTMRIPLVDFYKNEYSKMYLYIANMKNKTISNSSNTNFNIDTEYESIYISIYDFYDNPIDMLHISEYDIEDMSNNDLDITREDNMFINGITFESYKTTSKYSTEYVVVGLLDDSYYLYIRYCAGSKNVRDITDLIKDFEIVQLDV